MRTAYRVLAWLIAAEVVVQGAAIAWAVFGLGKWVEAGGVLDKAVMESQGTAFPEELGFAVHGINGQMVVPVLTLALLVVAFFAKLPRGVALAGAVVGLVVVQVLLGMLGHGVPVLGLLHGATALVLFAAAVVAARVASRPVGPVGVPADTGRHGAATPF
jgi:hypothetical protein